MKLFNWSLMQKKKNPEICRSALVGDIVQWSMI
jgi:hypothetical protein